MRVEIDGQIRGILKTFGLVVGSGNKGAFAQRARMLAQDHPVLSALIDKLIEVREVAVAKVAALDKEIRRFVRDDLTLRRFIAVPGVGPFIALGFRSTIDEPNRFKPARDVGPYLGLTPRLLSVRSNGPARRDMENAGTRILPAPAFMRLPASFSQKSSAWSPPQGMGNAAGAAHRIKKTHAAVARKIAVILQCIWTDRTEVLVDQRERPRPNPESMIAGSHAQNTVLAGTAG